MCVCVGDALEKRAAPIRNQCALGRKGGAAGGVRRWEGRRLKSGDMAKSVSRLRFCDWARW